MQCDFVAIRDGEIPSPKHPQFAHVVLTYASETNKTASIRKAIPAEHIDYSPHDKTNTIRTIMKHQLLSERRFFFEFVGLEEAPKEELIPKNDNADVE